MNKKLINLVFIFIFLLLNNVLSADSDLENSLDDLEGVLGNLLTLYDGYECEDGYSLIKDYKCKDENSNKVIDDLVCCPESDVLFDCITAGVKDGKVYSLISSCPIDKRKNITHNVYVPDGKFCCESEKDVNLINGEKYYYEIIDANYLKIYKEYETIFVNIEIETNLLGLKSIYIFRTDEGFVKLNSSDDNKIIDNDFEQDHFFYKFIDENKDDLITELKKKNSFIQANYVNKDNIMIRAVQDVDDLYQTVIMTVSNDEVNLSNAVEVKENLDEVFFAISASDYEQIQNCISSYPNDISVNLYADFIQKNYNSFISRMSLNYYNNDDGNFNLHKFSTNIKSDEYCYTIRSELKRKFLEFYDIKSGAQRFLENVDKFVNIQDDRDKFCLEECGNNPLNENFWCSICPPNIQGNGDAGVRVDIYNNLLIPALIIVPIINVFQSDGDLFDSIGTFFSSLEEFSKADLPITDYSDFFKVTGLSEIIDEDHFLQADVDLSPDDCLTITTNDITLVRPLFGRFINRGFCKVNKANDDIDIEEDPLTLLTQIIDWALEKGDMKDVNNEGLSDWANIIKEMGDIDYFVSKACMAMVNGSKMFSKTFSDFDDYRPYGSGDQVFFNPMMAWNYSVVSSTEKLNYYSFYFNSKLPWNITPNVINKNCYVDRFYSMSSSDDFGKLSIIVDTDTLKFKDDLGEFYNVDLGEYANSFDIISNSEGFCFKGLDSQYCYPTELRFEVQKQITGGTKLKFIYKNDNEIKFLLQSNYDFYDEFYDDNSLICVENDLDNFYPYSGVDQVSDKDDVSSYNDDFKIYFIFYDDNNNSDILTPFNFEFTTNKNHLVQQYTFMDRSINLSRDDQVLTFKSSNNYTKVCTWFNYDLAMLEKGKFEFNDFISDITNNEERKKLLASNYPYCIYIHDSPEGYNDAYNFALSDESEESESGDEEPGDEPSEGSEGIYDPTTEDP